MANPQDVLACPFDCGELPTLHCTQDETSHAGHAIAWYATLSCPACGIQLSEESADKDRAILRVTERWNHRVSLEGAPNDELTAAEERSLRLDNENVLREAMQHWHDKAIRLGVAVRGLTLLEPLAESKDPEIRETIAECLRLLPGEVYERALPQERDQRLTEIENWLAVVREHRANQRFAAAALEDDAHLNANLDWLIAQVRARSAPGAQRDTEATLLAQEILDVWDSRPAVISNDAHYFRHTAEQSRKTTALVEHARQIVSASPPSSTEPDK